MRDVDYTAPAAPPTSRPTTGAELTVHYRFAESNWGVGAKAGIIWLDDDYDTITVGTEPAGRASRTRSPSSASS